MKARIRRISASVDTAISFGSSASADATCSAHAHDLNSSTEMPHGYNPSSKSLDICVPESRIERMRKLLSSPLLRRRNASQHGGNCVNLHGHSHNHGKGAQVVHHPPGSSSSSSPSSSPALGNSSNASSMKTFGVSLESLAHHQHPHHHKHKDNRDHHPEECYVRDPEQIIVPHEKAAHILGKACPGCLTSAPSNSSSTGSINDTTATTTTSSGHFSQHHISSHTDDFFTSSMSSSIAASPSSNSSSTTSSTSSTGGGGGGANGNPTLIPFIVSRLVNYIESSGGGACEGLFRISANAKLAEKLKLSFDVTGDAPLESEGDLASAAALLKQFLRELPQPLIPNGLQFLDVIRSLKSDHDTCVLSVKALVSQLPDENYYTLRYLIRFLHRIAQRFEENRMTANNLGIVFAPNIFRVCDDTYEALKNQSSANEVVNLLISEFGEIFNETLSVTGGTGARSNHSRDDLSGISCESEEEECAYACSLNITIPEAGDQSLANCATFQLNSEPVSGKDSSGSDKSSSDKSSDESGRSDAMMELDRKRKDYKSKCHKNHRTIDEFDDERCQSFDCGLSATNAAAGAQRQPPQRCNSDGTSEEQSGTGEDANANHRSLEEKKHSLRRQRTNSLTHHEIIITNSSDSVSADDSTTTTATTTGPTVYSMHGQLATSGRPGNERLLSSSDENHDRSSSFTFSTDPKFLCSESANGDLLVNLKTGRSGSCGSDCTENIATFTSDDDEEDSLSKSIASDCSGDSSPSSSSCSCHLSGNEAGSSSSLNENTDMEQTPMDCTEEEQHPAPQNAHLLENKPWQHSEEEFANSEPQLSRDHLLFDQGASSSNVFDFIHPNDVTLGGLAVDTTSMPRPAVCEEAPVSPSAFRSYLSNRLDETTLPPSPPVDPEAVVYAVRQRKEAKLGGRQEPATDMGTKKNGSEPLISRKPAMKAPGLKARNKRFQSIRRKLRQFDVDFEQENGYNPTYDHKMASSFARPLMIELSSLLNVRTCNLRNLEYYDIECESMKEDSIGGGSLGGGNSTTGSADSNDLESLSAKARSSLNWRPYGPEMSPSMPMSTEDIFNTIFGNAKEKSLTKIGEMMDEIQRTLTEKRIAANRPDSLDAMSSEQIFDEKLALQKALLRFEALHGRPDSKAERDIVRPVYDRYRLVKRYAARMIQKMGSKDSANELQPILEHQVCSFKSPTHSRSSSVQVPDSALAESDIGTATTESSTTIVSATAEQAQQQLQSADTSCSCPTIVVGLTPKGHLDMLTEVSKNLHEMSHEELLLQLREVRQQKRRLRAVLRTFENDFYKKTGRRVEKEDRCNMSSVYHCYKTTKGKIRLLDALVAKVAREQCEAQKIG